MKRSIVLAAALAATTAVSAAAAFRYVTSTDHQQIAYTVQGNGPAMLAIPGGPGIDGAYLRSALRGVQARSYVIDVRGTGASHVANTTANITIDHILSDFERLRAANHLRSWIVFGHSFGGYLAQAYAARYPQSVRALILVSSTAPDLRLEGQVQRSVSQMLSPQDRQKLSTLSLLYRTNPDEAMREQTDTILPYFFADRSKWRLVAPLVDPPHDSYAMSRAFFPDLQTHAFAGSLRSFRNPVLVVYGEKDGGVDVFSKSILDNTPTAHLAVIANAGHFVWIEQPRVFADTVNRYLRQLR